MTASRVRARLRKARQAQTRAWLQPEQKKENPKAAGQFVIFGNGNNYAMEFAEFVRRFPEHGRIDQPRARTGHFLTLAMAFARRVARRHQANKRARKQRLACR